ncbi:MAG TPA: histidine kinase [Bryobacteraceae bacterium]|nr:histidine kinase [Bryobacteraceae bacterium]
MLVSTINAREVESNRVSRLLHDEVGQVLSAVGLQLDVLKLDFKHLIPELVQRTNEIQQMLDQAVRQVRSLSYDLNPAVVERAGLQFAMDRLIGRFREQFPGSLRFLFDSSVRVPLEVGNAWYKISELALENSIKHSKAAKIDVHVRPTPKSITIEVQDNGIGFSVADAKQQSPGLGLLLMEHYASQASIDIVMKSTPAKGTLVRSIYRLPGKSNSPAAEGNK